MITLPTITPEALTPGALAAEPAAISTLRELSAAPPGKVSAAHDAGAPSAKASWSTSLSTAEPATAAHVHAAAANMHPASANMHPAPANMHAAAAHMHSSTAATAHPPSSASSAVRVLSECGRCSC